LDAAPAKAFGEDKFGRRWPSSESFDFARDKNVISVADNRFGEIENDKGLLSMRKSKSG